MGLIDRVMQILFMISSSVLMLVISYFICINLSVIDYSKQIINSKAIDLDNKIFRCNQVLSNVGAKPRGEK